MQREQFFASIFFCRVSLLNKGHQEEEGSAALWTSVACELRKRLEGLEEALVSREKGKLTRKV